MTFKKSEVITIPTWLFTLVLPLLVSGIVAWGVYKANAATVTEKVNKTEIEIQKLDNTKVSRDEMNLIILSLQRIESKLDTHIAEPNNN